MIVSINDLTELEILHATFSLIFVIISLIIGFKILLKYWELKRKEFITVGLTWIFLSTGYWGISISFLGILFFNYALEPILYISIEIVFLPLAIMCWIYSFSLLMYPQLKKKIVSIFLVICIPYEIFLIIFLVIDLKIIATMTGHFSYEHNLYSLVFQVFALLLAISTGVLFAKKSLESEDPKVHWKGRFLLIAFISFSVSAIIDVVVLMTPIILVIVRLILIFSAFEFYMGFFLPDRIAKILVKQEK